MEVSRLKTEIQRLKNVDDGGVGAKCVMLQNLLDDANRARETYERKYLESLQNKLSAESQLKDLQQGKVAEGYAPVKPPFRTLTHNIGSTEAYIRLRENLAASNNEASALRQKVSELEASLSSSERERASMKLDCEFPYNP